MTRAYSYQRFSTPEQLKGDSLRRQSEAAQQYADQHGLELDTSLTFQDLGVSAYKGANFEAALGRFIEAVDSGQVAKGSFLLVENLDRLSRDKILPALNRFQALLEKGITVVTLSDGKSYDADSLNNLPDLMLSLLVMSRAHEESATKSQRSRSAWKRKKEKAREGHKITTAAPAWIALEDGEWKVDQGKAAIVQRIYNLTLEGYGKVAIMNRLNKEGIPSIGNSDAWCHSYIYSILRNPAVIGSYQPYKLISGTRKREPEGDPIEDYFPAVIDKATFYKVQKMAKGASPKRGKVLQNTLTGLLRCSLCGGVVHYINRGGKRRAYVHCDNAKRKFTCDAKSMRYDKVLSAVLRKVDLPTPWLIGHQEQNKRKREIFEQLTSNEASQAELDGKIERLLDSLERTQSAAMERRLQQYEEEKEQLIASMERWSDQLDSVNGNGDHLAETRAAVEEFNRVMTGDDEEKIGAIRVRLNACLKKLIERVEVGPAGVKVIPKGTLTAPELGREVGRDGSFTFKLD